MTIIAVVEEPAAPPAATPEVGQWPLPTAGPGHGGPDDGFTVEWQLPAGQR